jgi:hypothetical protein
VFAQPNGGLRLLRVCAGLSAAGAIVLWVLFVRGVQVRAVETVALVVTAGAIAAKVFVIAASPQPLIDVHSLTTQAAQFLLSGKNPYHQVYRDVYQQGRLDAAQLFQYPPGYLLWASAFFRVLGDVRWNQVFAELASVLALFQIVREQARDRAFAWIVVIAWLSFPVGYFVIEQAWVDPFVAALAAWIAWALQRRRLLTAGVLSGVLLVSKQYGVLAVVVTGAWIFAHHRARWHLFAAGASVAAAVILAPFILSDSGGLYRATVEAVLNTAMRPDALTIRALLLDRWGLSIPEWPAAAIDAIAVLLVCWRVSRPHASGLHAWAGALAFLYLLVFICGPQAFCNYYYLVSFFVLLCIGFHVTKADGPTGQTLHPHSL